MTPTVNSKRYLLKIKGITDKVFPFILILVIITVTLLLGGNACLFKNFTGIPCPGCGMTRAFFSLAKLDFSTAFYYHPLFLLPVFVGVIMAFKRNRFIKCLYNNNILWLCVLILVLVVWVIRMKFLFPDNPPMDINTNAVLQKILRFLTS